MAWSAGEAACGTSSTPTLHAIGRSLDATHRGSCGARFLAAFEKAQEQFDLPPQVRTHGFIVLAEHLDQMLHRALIP